MGDRAPGSNKRTPERLSLWIGRVQGRLGFYFRAWLSRNQPELPSSRLAARSSLAFIQSVSDRPAFAAARSYRSFSDGSARILIRADRDESPLGGLPRLASVSMSRNVLTKFCNVNDFDLNCLFM